MGLALAGALARSDNNDVDPPQQNAREHLESARDEVGKARENAGEEMRKGEEHAADERRAARDEMRKADEARAGDRGTHSPAFDQRGQRERVAGRSMSVEALVRD